jgi:hypothetical protein
MLTTYLSDFTGLLDRNRGPKATRDTTPQRTTGA